MTTPKANSTSDPTNYIKCDNIAGLPNLFQWPIGADHEGFPQGSTIVLSGSPGAGKTTFALGLVRSMMRGEFTKNDNKNNALPEHIVYYVSTEVRLWRLKQMFGSRGWFTDNDKLFETNPEGHRTSGLHVINPPLEIERPVKSSEELVNFIVRKIAAEPAPEPKQKVFIIVDSITALFRDTEGSHSRRQIHELIYRLREQFKEGDLGKAKGSAPSGGVLGLILLLSEVPADNPETMGMETYVADFVFNLGQKPQSLGTRLRVLEVKKSQGANMIMGEHTWNIVTNKSIRRLIAGEALRKKIRACVSRAEGFNDLDRAKAMELDGSDKAWGTVVVASRPYSNALFEGTNESAQPEVTPVASGICGLDEMLKDDPDYWFLDPTKVMERRADGKDSHESIKPGSVTMLVGEPGTGKTSLCYHLVASHLMSGKLAERTSNALLVGFEHDFGRTFPEFAKKFALTGNKKTYEGLTDADLVHCDYIYRTRTGLHFNLLLLEIREWLSTHHDSDKRVAIDGLSNLASTHTRHEFSQMLDSLVNLFSEPIMRPGVARSTHATLFLTYEVLENNSVLDSDTLRLPADNIVRFSHRVVEDRRRTAVMVIKSSHSEHDKLVRELVLDHVNPAHTHIRSGFDAYSGLLNNNIRPAEVVLQLFQENCREKAYNTALQEHLNTLLPYKVSLRDFSRFQISSALEGKNEHIKVPSGDVLVSHSDEWWMAHKVQELERLAFKARKEKDARTKDEKKEKELLILLGQITDDLTSAPEAVEATRLTTASKTIQNKIDRLQFKFTDPFALWRDFRVHAIDNQMTKLAGFVTTDATSAVAPGDFWCFEMEKTWLPDDRGRAERDIGPYGLPAYLDFGMLCLHRDCIKDPKDRPACHYDYASNWEDVDRLPWDAASPRLCAQEQRRAYLQLLAKYMIPWCRFSGDWFKSPDENMKKGNRTLVDAIRGFVTDKNRAEDESTIQYGFAWDSRTPETASAFFYELAWAFGGTQHLFCERDPLVTSTNRKAAERALSFIGYLVHEGLMPACPTLTDTAKAAFSRQYYSTYIDVVNRADPSGASETPTKHISNPILISLCFMPPGPDCADTRNSMAHDGREHKKRFRNRLKQMQIINQSRNEIAAKPPISRSGFMNLLKTVYGAQECARISPNPTDILELDKWANCRHLVQSHLSWEEILEKGEKLANGLPVVAVKTVERPRVGHGCCGAWAIGIKSPTSGPGLAQVLLQEITSLQMAKRRARMGAGLPARQDFYKHYGDRPVPGMEFFTWREALMFFGSTARRRDRLYYTPEMSNSSKQLVDPAKMHRLIHHAVIEIMQVANQCLKQSEAPIQATAKRFAEQLFADATPT